jgi:hypothetical protein
MKPRSGTYYQEMTPLAPCMALLAALLAAPAPQTGSAPPEAPPEATLPLSPQEIAEGLLPSAFTRHETRHWTILSDARPATIDHVGEQLESAMHQFSRLCRMLGSARPMPQERMLCIVFSDAEDFQEFARHGDEYDIDPDVFGGYFSSKTEWILFYDPKGTPELEEARDALDEHEEALDTIRSEPRSAHEDPRTRARREHALQQQTKRIEEARRNLDEFERARQMALTVHEAFHQLAWITEFADHRGGWGLWLHEGFATGFETEDITRAYGPAHESAKWRASFKQAMVDGQLLPLRELLTIRTLDGMAPDQVTAFYAQSYATVRWLWRFRRTRLNGYIRSLRDDPDLAFPRDDLKAFESAFGPIETLERRWLRDEMDEWSAGGD